MRHQACTVSVADQRPPWHPRHVRGRQRPIACPAERRLEGTPGQVRRQALPFLLRLGTPAPPAQPAGKGRGRATGYLPHPRQRFAVVKKGKKQRKAA